MKSKQLAGYIFARKNLGRRGWWDYWRFLKSSSCCSHSATVLLGTCNQSDNTRCKAAWISGLKYLPACGLALISRPLGLSTSDNNSKKRDNLLLPSFYVLPTLHRRGQGNSCLQQAKCLQRYYATSKDPRRNKFPVKDWTNTNYSQKTK